MHPAGLRAYRQRDEEKSAQASYEQEEVSLKKEYKEKIRTNPKAWAFFQELAPGYTRTSIHWVMSAKKEKTRQRRLQILIESCEKEQKIPLLRRG
ncbi:Bacteriocin-protection, YdeI or OmpD-Associated [Fodinibius roseus]|uniref:Bacteriocin-protection, YdeI or OmpD-Associated n=1 Tax=Fodinibius roseus TaxID=1194090 RepID=A0A1M4YQP5_9BACT|nr:YdeI/OmpD-associated family protein [Fodinibius roseus]SHF08169.1 Bacteriocin-protection, YdeI or OmpD-Associated [Fodinibius roseus]